MGKRSNTRKRKRWVDLIIGAIVGAVAGWALSPLLNEVWFSMFPTEPHFISYSTHRVELLDRTGSSIGVIKLDARVREALLADVNEDGKKEVVVGTDEGRIKPGYVMVFTAKGRTLWEFDTFEERIMTNLSGGHSDHFRISEIQIASLFGQGRKYIVAMAQDPTWFAARLIILDPRTAELVTSYWHPGQVGNMSVADIDNDGRSELVFCGVNNNLRHLFRTVKNIPVAFALSPEIGMNAQAFPGGFPGLPSVPGLWYLIIPPVLTGLSINVENYDDDGIADVRIATSDGRFYYINHKTEIIGVGAGDSWRESHPASGIPIPLYIDFSEGEWQIEHVSINTRRRTPDVGNLRLSKALLFYNAGDYNSAIAELRIAREANPEIEDIVRLWEIRAMKEGEYGFLGVQIEDAVGGGVKIVELLPKTPAELMELEQGDIIKAIDNLSVSNSYELNMRLAQRNPGDTIELLIERGKVLSTKSGSLISPKIEE